MVGKTVVVEGTLYLHFRAGAIAMTMLLAYKTALSGFSCWFAAVGDSQRRLARPDRPLRTVIKKINLTTGLIFKPSKRLEPAQERLQGNIPNWS
jgi:hypothetical protein